MIQGSQEWHEFRKNHIGASDAPIIMGASPWGTKYSLWLEKLDLATPRPSSPAMKRGIDLEDLARKEFKDVMGVDVFPKVLTHAVYPWMSASMDGISKCGNVAVEIKCPGSKDHSLAMEGIIPDKYFPQLQHQLAVCGLDMIYYLSFDGEEGIILKIHRDMDYINNLIELEKAFYDCVVNLIPPELEDRDFLTQNSAEWIALALEYKLVTMQLKELERKQNELKENLCGMSGQHNSIGGGIRLQKIAKKGSIQYSNIPQLSDVDLEKFRKSPSSYWKITEIY
jgi:putative phage-type endonuclease